MAARDAAADGAMRRSRHAACTSSCAMNAPSLRQRTLQRALEISGDARRLSRRLRVPMDDLQEWLKGRDVPPTAVFLAAVDVVVGWEGDARPAPLIERRRQPRARAAAATASQAA
jgi:hypothetical protein